MERVVAALEGSEVVAYPFPVLTELRAVHDQVGRRPIVVFYQPGTASALDSPNIAQGRGALPSLSLG